MIKVVINAKTIKIKVKLILSIKKRQKEQKVIQKLKFQPPLT